MSLSRISKCTSHLRRSTSKQTQTGMENSMARNLALAVRSQMWSTRISTSTSRSGGESTLDLSRWRTQTELALDACYGLWSHAILNHLSAYTISLSQTCSSTTQSSLQVLFAVLRQTLAQDSTGTTWPQMVGGTSNSLHLATLAATFKARSSMWVLIQALTLPHKLTIFSSSETFCSTTLQRSSWIW